MTLHRPLAVFLIGATHMLSLVGCSGGGTPNANPAADKSPSAATKEKGSEQDPAKGEASSKPSEKPSGEAKSRRIRLGAAQEALEKIDAEPLPDFIPIDKVPVVKLSVGHQASCRIGVGQALPDASLSDINGSVVAMSKARGEKLTLVLFWSGDLAFGLEAFSDLTTNLVKPYSNAGLQVVSIHVGPMTNEATAAAKANASFFPVLLDPQGAYFAKIAQSKLPRMYLLDSEGKIVWFDLEYSRSSKRELHQIIRLKLGMNPPAKKKL